MVSKSNRTKLIVGFLFSFVPLNMLNAHAYANSWSGGVSDRHANVSLEHNS